MYVCETHVCLMFTKVQSTGTGGTDNCKPPYGYWESNSALLKRPHLYSLFLRQNLIIDLSYGLPASASRGWDLRPIPQRYGWSRLLLECVVVTLNFLLKRTEQARHIPFHKLGETEHLSITSALTWFLHGRWTQMREQTSNIEPMFFFSPSLQSWGLNVTYKEPNVSPVSRPWSPVQGKDKGVLILAVRFVYKFVSLTHIEPPEIYASYWVQCPKKSAPKG